MVRGCHLFLHCFFNSGVSERLWHLRHSDERRIRLEPHHHFPGRRAGISGQNGLTQPFIGHLFDRLGGRRVILVGLVIIGLATFALSFTFHILFLIFVFSFVLSTALSGPSLTNTMALLSKWFRRKRATAVAFNSAGTSFGGFLLVPFAMYLLQATNWRVTWAVLGLALLVLALPLSFLFIRDDPAERGIQPDGDPEQPEDSHGGVPSTSRMGRTR